MARVTLAYRYRDHEAGETIDVDDDEAVGLVRDGLAQRADEGQPEGTAEPAATDPAGRPADDDDEVT